MGTENLTITHGKPHNRASAYTISCWVKEELQLDISTFSTHSCCATSVSKTKVMGISVKEILSRAY